MSDDPLDMTGMWEGAYGYDGHVRVTMPFVANITEHAGRLTGSIIEPATDEEAFHAEEIEAAVAGVRGGQAVDFVKTYVGRTWAHSVDYVGKLSPDGQLVTGTWAVETLNGTFEMRRQTGWQEVIAAEAEESLDEPATVPLASDRA